MISTTSSSGPRSTAQRKRQRLDQLVGRIAHLVGSAPLQVAATTANNNNNNSSSNNKNHHLNNNNNSSSKKTVVGGKQGDKVKLATDERSKARGRFGSSEDEEEEEEEEEEDIDEQDDRVVSNMESSGESPSPLQQTSSSAVVNMSTMSRLRMARGNLRHLHHHHSYHHHPHHHHQMLRHPIHRVGGNSNGQVFSFDHVQPSGTGNAASDDEGEEEVFSPGLTSYSDRLTLSPCSQSSCTVESPSGISFSPLSFTDDDAAAAAAAARCCGVISLTRSSPLIASDPSTPLNLSTTSSGSAASGCCHGNRSSHSLLSPSSMRCKSAGITPPPVLFQRSPLSVSGSASGAADNGLTADSCEEETSANRRRARSDSDLRDSPLRHRPAVEGSLSPLPTVSDSSAAPASWVLTPASAAGNRSSSSLLTPPSSGSASVSASSSASSVRLVSSRLEHLRPPPLMVSLKRNSSDSTDSSWSPVFGQQESPVDLSVRSCGGSLSSDSPNQTSNTSTASVSSNELLSTSYSSAVGVNGLETPPPQLKSCSSLSNANGSSSSAAASSTSTKLGKSRGSRLKALTRSISLTQYLSAAEYASSTSLLDLRSPDPLTTPLLLSSHFGSLLQHHHQQQQQQQQHHSLMSNGFGCDLCGQVFDQHDRLVKHIASRHKTAQQQQQQAGSAPHTPQPSPSATSGGAASGGVVKGYQCEVCQRPFARSDMLTRHMRLHTGLKPYTCRICGQVFSRSDHLSTHQRTHTGEKPYRCPQCSYAACRRDMITRHLRTHTRSEDLDALGKDSG